MDKKTFVEAYKAVADETSTQVLRLLTTRKDGYEIAVQTRNGQILLRAINGEKCENLNALKLKILRY